VLGPNTITADYIAVYADHGKTIYANSGSPITVTLPNSFPLSWTVNIVQEGAGAVTVAAAGGGSVLGFALTTTAQYEQLTATVMSNPDDASAAWRVWSSSSGSGGGMAIGGAVTSGTSGSVLFIDGSSDLAQDNSKFFWDDTNYILKLGDAGTSAALYLNALPAIYEVPNVSGNNWFEGNAGNTTLSGSGNFGTGDGALAALTTGIGNVAIGGDSLSLGPGNPTLGRLSTGTKNTALGATALAFCVSNTQNMAIGTDSLRLLGSTAGGDFNTAVGASTLSTLGATAGGCDNNTGIGQNAGGQVFAGSNNTFVGTGSAISMSGTVQNNTVLGASSGANLTGGNFNLILGSWLGPSTAPNDLIVLVGGRDQFMPALDAGFISGLRPVWSFTTRFNSEPAGIHIYNTMDIAAAPPTNYERGILDWNPTANVFTIGTQAGGTGSTRNIEVIIGGTNKLDYGITNAGKWTAAADIVTTGDLYTTDAAFFIRTKATLTDGAGTGAGVTFTNAPGASLTTGNPTKWIAIDDNGTTRYIPAF
jgi:hypothetical protein